MSPLTTKQEDENRELWNKNVLSSLRAHFKIFGDRRDGRTEMYHIVSQYGVGMPPMSCSCGVTLSWEDWPDHWRDKHGV